VPIAFQNASRKHAAAGVAAYGTIVAAIVGYFFGVAAWAPVVVISAMGVWRNLIGGVFVTEDALLVRNLTHSVRLPRSDVAEVTVMAGAHDTTGAGYVCVISKDGTCHQATGLRRDPLRGEALAAAIREAIATR
jgi:hypothetical protein